MTTRASGRGRSWHGVDPRDYETALTRSRAQLAHDEALVLDAEAAVDRQPSMIEESKAEAGAD